MGAAKVGTKGLVKPKCSQFKASFWWGKSSHRYCMDRFRTVTFHDSLSGLSTEACEMDNHDMQKKQSNQEISHKCFSKHLNSPKFISLLDPAATNNKKVSLFHRSSAGVDPAFHFRGHPRLSTYAYALKVHHPKQSAFRDSPPIPITARWDLCQGVGCNPRLKDIYISQIGSFLQ